MNLDELRLNAGDICRLTGVRDRLLDRWATAGVLRPVNNHKGHGRHRIYTFDDLVAVFIGQRYLDAGAPPERAAGVVALLSKLGHVGLEHELAVGRTVPVPRSRSLFDLLPDDVMIEPERLTGLLSERQIEVLLVQLDTRVLYEEVKAKVTRSSAASPVRATHEFAEA